MDDSNASHERLVQNDDLAHLSPSQLRVLVDAELAKSDRADRALSVLLLDVDGVESVCRGLGQNIGDAVLRQLAERLKLTVRQNDVVGHRGGDQFVIVCGDTASDDARLLAKRLVMITSESLEQAPTSFRLSSNIGIATLEAGSAESSTADDLIARASTALGESQRFGRSGFTAVVV